MKAYMGYSDVAGSEEGAVLVFAPNGKRARALAYPYMQDFFYAEWIDVRTKFLRDLPAHLAKLDNGTEQVFDDPDSCPRCSMWGGKLVGDDGCQWCVEGVY